MQQNCIGKFLVAVFFLLSCGTAIAGSGLIVAGQDRDTAIKELQRISPDNFVIKWDNRRMAKIISQSMSLRQASKAVGK
jgi:hypothetical protein